MFNRNIIDKSVFKGIFYITAASVICILVYMFFISLTAFIITKTDFSYELLNPVTSAISAVSSFVCGFMISRWFKEKGLFCGIFAALVLSLFLCILSLYYSSFEISRMFVIKTSIIFVSGSAGGITGVNTN